MKLVLFLFFIIYGCAHDSPKEVVRGYDESSYEKISAKLRGKDSNQAIKYLGKPAIAGESPDKKFFRLIYPTKNMQRFYMEILYKTDVELDCTVIDLYPTKQKKRAIIKKYLRCNQSDGVIIQLQNQEK